MSQSAKRGKIAAIDASRTPYKIKTDDGEVRVSTQGAVAIRKLKLGDRVDLEWYAGEWYAFPVSDKTEDRMSTMRDVFEAVDSGKGAPQTVAKVLYAIMKVLKCTASVANKIFAVYRGEKIIKIDGGTGNYETSHGQFWDKDVLERAVAMYDASESKYKKHKASDDMVKRAEEMMKEGW